MQPKKDCMQCDGLLLKKGRSKHEDESKVISGA